MSGKAKKTATSFDESRYLSTDEEVAEYITEALMSGDLEYVLHAIGVAAKARGMTQIAEQTGLSRESLYKSLRSDGAPKFETIGLVLQALGLRLRVEPAPDPQEGPAEAAKETTRPRRQREVA